MELSFYWDDLKPEKQKEILALLGDNQNWDVFPFCTIEINEASSQQSKSQAGNMTVIEEEFVEPDNDV